MKQTKKIRLIFSLFLLSTLLLTGCVTTTKIEEGSMQSLKEALEQEQNSENKQAEATTQETVAEPEATPEPTAKPKEWNTPEDYRVVDTYVAPESIAGSAYDMEAALTCISLKEAT